jgi:RNA polymerase sigma factor (sigma-70 family)
MMLSWFRRSIETPSLFAELYDRHGGRVVRYVARRVGAIDAEDIAAEVFVRAYSRRAACRGEHGSVLPWLLGVANHVIADHRRVENRRLETLERLAETMPTSVEHEQAGLAPELLRALRRVPAADRDALLLVVWGELSYDVAATALDVPIGTVHQPRVDMRLHMLCWHLADRWGRVRADGTIVPLRLSHSVLADLVAAGRPTVSSALSDLAERELVRPLDEGWLRSGEPPAELLEVQAIDVEALKPQKPHRSDRA